MNLVAVTPEIERAYQNRNRVERFEMTAPSRVGNWHSEIPAGRISHVVVRRNGEIIPIRYTIRGGIVQIEDLLFADDVVTFEYEWDEP